MTYFHRPKQASSFSTQLPINRFQCDALLRSAAGILQRSETMGDEQGTIASLQMLEHLRYRYIILNHLTDWESMQYRLLFEAALPDYKCRYVQGECELIYTPISSDVLPCTCSACASKWQSLVRTSIVSELDVAIETLEQLEPAACESRSLNYEMIEPIIHAPEFETATVVLTVVSTNVSDPPQCTIAPETLVGRAFHRSDDVAFEFQQHIEDLCSSTAEVSAMQLLHDVGVLRSARSELCDGRYYYRHQHSTFEEFRSACVSDSLCEANAKLQSSSHQNDGPMRNAHAWANQRLEGLISHFCKCRVLPGFGYVTPALYGTQVVPLRVVAGQQRTRAFLNWWRVRKRLK